MPNSRIPAHFSFGETLWVYYIYRKQNGLRLVFFLGSGPFFDNTVRFVEKNLAAIRNEPGRGELSQPASPKGVTARVSEPRVPEGISFQQHQIMCVEYERFWTLLARGLLFWGALGTLTEFSISPALEMKTILILVLITLIPTLELRASIPFGILGTDMSWWGAALVCVATNMILGPLVYLFLDRVMVLLLRFKWLNRAYQRTVIRTQRRIEKSVDRYGELGVALFIGIPLPVTGSYSGALGAYLIGLGYRKFIIANVIGVLMAGAIITTIVLSGVQAFRILIKVI